MPTDLSTLLPILATTGSLCCAGAITLLGGALAFRMVRRGTAAPAPAPPRPGLGAPPAAAAPPGGMRATVTEAFERTGYRHAALGPAPLGDHVEHSLRSPTSGHQHVHLVRPLDGGTLHFEQRTGEGLASVAFTCTWWVPLAGPPAVQLQIVERRFLGVSGLAAGLATTQERTLPAPLAHPVISGNEAFDARFRVTSDVAGGAPGLLSDPALQAELLALSQVDLSVGPERARFDDPMQDNLRAALGGVAEMRAAARHPERLFARQFAVHDQMADLLRRLLAGTGAEAARGDQGAGPTGA